MSTTTEKRDGKTAVKIRRKDGVEQTYWKGNKPPTKADRPRPTAPMADETRSINPLDWSLPRSDRMSRRRSARRARRAAARHSRIAERGAMLMEKPVEEMPDWHLWKARDLCRDRMQELDRAITNAPDPEAAKKGMKILAAIEKRKEELDLENERRNREPFRNRARRNLVLGMPTLSRLYYRSQGKNPDEAQAAVTRPAGATPSPSKVHSGSDPAVFEKVGRFLTSWWDGLMDFFSQLRRS